MLEFQTGCIPPFEYKPDSIWDDILLILMLIAYLVLYVGGAYFLMRWLKLTIQRLKKYSVKE